MSRHERLVVPAALTCAAIAAPGPAQAEEAEPNATELVRATRRSERWMYDFDSLLVRARGRWAVTPEAHAVRRRRIQESRGVDEPDVRQFPDLRKAYQDTLEYAVDRQRVRYLTDDPGYWRQLKIWEGNELMIHEKYYHHAQEQYVLDSKIEQRTFQELFACNYGWPRSQPHSFWWNQRNVDEAMYLHGAPESFRAVGRRTYRGIPCHVLEYEAPEDRAPGLAWRWFVGRADHLLYGIELLRQGRVTSEHWMTDYREVVPGGWFPLKTGWALYEADEAGRLYLASTRDLETVELRVNEPLADELFAWTIEPGVEVHDLRSGKRRIYRPWRNLSGKELPSFEGIEPPPEAEKGTRSLVVFVDVEQRPSRRALQKLVAGFDSLTARGVRLIVIQASNMADEALRTWQKKLSIPVPLRTVARDTEAMRRVWGARSLPWLILADEKHIVRAEGFSVDELEERMEQMSSE